MGMSVSPHFRAGVELNTASWKGGPVGSSKMRLFVRPGRASAMSNGIIRLVHDVDCMAILQEATNP
jgi:hypothetical protein